MFLEGGWKRKGKPAPPRKSDLSVCGRSVGDMTAMRRPWILLCLSVIGIFPLAGFSDAIFVNRSMTASTIAEVYITDNAIRVELEIGVDNLRAFRNLLPDGIYEKLGFGAKPLADRLATFFKEDFVIRDDGKPLMGKIVSMKAQSRIQRDEITGEALKNQPTDAETTIFVELEYPLTNQPKTLSFQPPRDPQTERIGANIGLVVYHNGVAVNDFRYLARTEPLVLDWADPWYSQFKHRPMWRQYRAPLMGFLYVDAFEVRKEFIVRPGDLQQWVDLGLKGKKTIPVEMQVELKKRAAAFLAGRCPVTIDGKKVVGSLDRIHFVRRSLKMTGVIDPPEELSIDSATLGVIFTYPVVKLPQKVTMDWDLFSKRIGEVPVVATDEAGGLGSVVTPEDPVLVWDNFLTHPSGRSLAIVGPLPVPGRLSLPLTGAGLALLGAIAGIVGLRHTSRRRAIDLTLCGGLLLASVLCWPMGQMSIVDPFDSRPQLNEGDSGEVITSLLKNIYRAFDFRDESEIYDVLAMSTSGDLLPRVYLETRKGLELQNQGGARVKVKDVKLIDVKTTPLKEEPGFTALSRWRVTGSVGHWGHIHQRNNEYEARLTLKPIDGVWKITDIELLDEKRL